MNPKNMIHYRDYNKKVDYSLQRKLFALSFPEAIGTAINTDEHYNWKFENFPSSITSYEYVADEILCLDREIVGYYAALPFAYKIGANKNILCGMVCDVMTHPNRRGKGIFTDIGRYATDDLKNKGLGFVSGYPVRPEVIPGHLKVGWRIVQKMPMYLRPLGIGSFLPTSIKFLSKIFNPLLSGFQFWTHFGLGDYKTQVMSVEDFLELKEYPHFLNLWISEQKNALIKSKEFLKWRTGAPGAKYYFIVLRHNEKFVGFSLVRPTVLKGIESLAILDMAILNDYFKGSRKLHDSIYKLAVSLKKDVVVCISSIKWAKEYHFLSSFYIPTPTFFSLIIKKLDNDLKDEELYSSDSWHLFWIDSDDL